MDSHSLELVNRLETKQSGLKRYDKCWNCYLDGHDTEDCRYIHFQCHVKHPFPRDKSGKPCVYQKCFPILYIYPRYDRNYIQIHMWLNNDGQNAKLLPDSIDLVAQLYHNRLQCHRFSTEKDQTILDIQHRDLCRSTPNSLYLHRLMGVFNGQTLVQLAENFLLKKTVKWTQIRYFPTSMWLKQISATQFLQRSSKVPIPDANPARKRFYFTELHFNENEETYELWTLLDSLSIDSRVVIKTGWGKRSEHLWQMSRRENGELVVTLVGTLRNLHWDENGEIRDARNLSLSFDFGGRQLSHQIKLLKTFLDQFENKTTNPRWLHDHLFMDMNGRIWETGAIDLPMKLPSALLPGVLVPHQIRFMEFFDVLTKGTVFLNRSQFDAIMGTIYLESFAIKGPPGTGKTLVMAAAILYHACVLNKKCLVLSSRNHSANDITNKIGELYQNLPKRWAGCVGDDYDHEFDGFLMRHFPSSRDVHEGLNQNVGAEGAIEHISNYMVLVTTVGHSIVPLIRLFPAAVLFIDEAALLTPVELLSTLAGRHVDVEFSQTKFQQRKVVREKITLPACRIQKLVLIGDPEQMRPRYSNIHFATEKFYNATALNMSGLTRMFRNQAKGSNVTALLDQSRRFPRAIGEPVFQRWYNNEVEIRENPNSGVTFKPDYVRDSTAFGKCSYASVLQSVYIRVPNNTDVEYGLSRQNLTSCKFPIDTMLTLVKSCILKKNAACVKPEDIYYLSFYKAQVGLVDREIEKYPELNGVKTFTVDKVQGLEAPVVIVDAVRTRNTPGFMVGQEFDVFGMHNNGRVVVALSRAQELRIFIGNSSKMKGLKGNDYIKSIEHADETESIEDNERTGEIERIENENALLINVGKPVDVEKIEKVEKAERKMSDLYWFERNQMKNHAGTGPTFFVDIM